MGCMKKSFKKTKKVTIDGLAVMVARGFSGVDKRFDVVEKDISELKKDVSELKKDVSELKKDVSELKKDVSELKKDTGELKEGNKDIRRDIFNLGDRFVPYHMFDKLASRVNMLEKKVK